MNSLQNDVLTKQQQPTFRIFTKPSHCCNSHTKSKNHNDECNFCIILLPISSNFQKVTQTKASSSSNPCRWVCGSVGNVFRIRCYCIFEAWANLQQENAKTHVGAPMSFAHANTFFLPFQHGGDYDLGTSWLSAPHWYKHWTFYELTRSWRSLC